MLVHHFGLWAWTAHRRGFTLSQVLERWDSALYSEIVTHGYSSALRAFLPLYPGAVWLTSGGAALAPQWVGTLLSTLLLLAFVFLASAPGSVPPLGARTRWGWFVFLFSPASFALHSHHTEGLFLLLSFGALWAAGGGRALAAGLLAGACVWTRNQGVLVAVTAALLAAGSGVGRAQQLRRFLLCGGVAFAGFLALLGYQALRTGDPLAHMHAQAGWAHATSAWSLLRTLWLGNPWQNTSTGSLQRYAWFFVSVALALGLWRRSRPLGLYALASLALMLMQGELVNGFRFTAVLFPLAFYAGERLARLPPWARVALAALLVFLNHDVTRRYALGWWAY
jgi:hypothetical protein